MSQAKSKNIAASVRQRLVNLSQKRGEEFQFILSQYAIERLLYCFAQRRAERDLEAGRPLAREEE